MYFLQEACSVGDQRPIRRYSLMEGLPHSDGLVIRWEKTSIGLSHVLMALSLGACCTTLLLGVIMYVTYKGLKIFFWMPPLGEWWSL